MFTPYGNRLYGRIEECGTTCLATRFFHIAWLPLIPSETVLVLTQAGFDYHFFPQPLSGRSLLAALLRTWGVVLILFPGIPLMAGALTGSQGLSWPVALGFLFHVAVVVYAFTGLGKLSSKERAQRMVYSNYVDFAVDVARVGKFLVDLRRNLRDELNRLAHAQGQTAGSPTGQLDHISRALDPKMLDVAYLRAALVLTRLEWSESRGQMRAKRDAQHEAIWAKLESMGGQESERRVPQREWVDLGGPAVVVAPPAPEQESRVPEREWVDLNPTVATSPPAPTPPARGPLPQTPGPASDSEVLRMAARSRLQSRGFVRSGSAAKSGTRARRPGVRVAVISGCVLLGVVGLVVMHGFHKRMLARLGEQEHRAPQVKLTAVSQPEVIPLHALADCHMNLPRTWNAVANQEENTPYKSLGATNPKGDMSLYAGMWPLDTRTESEEQLALKLAGLRADKTTLMESDWLDLPIQRAWREVRTLSTEPPLTEINYFIRKPAVDIQVRARVPSLNFPQFRRFLENIMQSVYCDEPGRAR